MRSCVRTTHLSPVSEAFGLLSAFGRLTHTEAGGLSESAFVMGKTAKWLVSVKAAKTTHGDCSNGKISPEYRVWTGMKTRCYNAKEKCFKNYGGRGIKVCDRWRNSFINFLEDMGRRPTLQHTIDRVDVNGNYEPSNCKWSTHSEQANNTRVSKFIEFNGVRLTQAQWAKRIGIHVTTLAFRLKAWGVVPAAFSNCDYRR